MSEKVSTFARVSAKGYRYVYLLVVWNDYYSAVREELKRQADAFAADLGLGGLFVAAFQRREHEVAEEVLAKPWERDLGERMRGEPEPILLIIERDFAEFDPREHPYAIIWLTDFIKEPYDLRLLLGALAEKTREGEDVIAYLRGVAARSQVGALGKLTKQTASTGQPLMLQPTNMRCKFRIGPRSGLSGGPVSYTRGHSILRLSSAHRLADWTRTDPNFCPTFARLR